MSLDDYKRKYGILVWNDQDGWRGSQADPFGRRERGGDERPRVVQLDSDPYLIGLRRQLGIEEEME